jgi:hypothetical protein
MKGRISLVKSPLIPLYERGKLEKDLEDEINGQKDNGM